MLQRNISVKSEIAIGTQLCAHVQILDDETCGAP